MKKIISFVFAIMMMTMCLAVTSCEKNDAVTVTRSFVAGYEQTVAMGANPMQMSGRNRYLHSGRQHLHLHR